MIRTTLLIILIILILVYLISSYTNLLDFMYYTKEKKHIPISIQGKLIHPHNWMSALYNIPGWKKLNLSQICIIGTHDSASGCLKGGGIKPTINSCDYKYSNFSDHMLTNKYLHAIARPFWFIISPYIIAWSKTQRYSIMEQLKLGVRYFDLRVWIHKNRMYFKHGNVVFKESADKLFADVSKFLRANRGEIIILHTKKAISDTDKITTSRIISRTIVNAFGNQLVKPNEIPANKISSSTIETILQQGQVIVSQRDTQPEFSNLIYGSDIVSSNYKSCNQPCTVGNKCIGKKEFLPASWTKLEENYLNCYAPFPKLNKLNVLQAHIQYNGSNILKIIGENILQLTWMPYSSNILNNTQREKINENISNWIIKNATNREFNINVVDVDNYQPFLINSAIIVNLKRANQLREKIKRDL